MAEKENEWFERDFIELKKGDALNLPIEDESVGIAAQNCLFNIFKAEDLKKICVPSIKTSRLVMSDPNV